MTNICCYCQEAMLQSEQSWYGLHQKCFQLWFDLREVSSFLDLAARSNSQAPQEKNFSFFHGAYRKYSARLGKSNYILKVQQKEYPELPATEFLCNQIFDSLNILIPEYYLIRFPEEKLCFVTKNFMYGLVASNLVHVYHFVRNGQHDCENLVAVIGEQTKRRTEQERFVCLTLADSLIGNHDRHGRNLGFIQSAQGMKLSHFYDNPSAIALENKSLLRADLQPRGSIFTKHSDQPTMKDYVKEWKRLGYNEVVNKFRKQLSLENIQTLIDKSYISKERKEALWRLIKNRSEELCAN